jgi:hypothetical protein
MSVNSQATLRPESLTNQELESKITELVAISEKLPERYREKCFEILLHHYLQTDRLNSNESVGPSEVEVPPEPTKFSIPLDVKAFLTQYGVAESDIPKLFYIEGPEIRPIYNLKKKDVIADAQIQLALLKAFENALRPGGMFEFSFDDVKKLCLDHKVYDSSNFKANFRNNARFFRGLKTEKHVELSPDGKSELAETISAVLE